MHARVMTFSGAKNIDDGLVFLREKAMPIVSAQQGYRGLTASADRNGGVFGILTSGRLRPTARPAGRRWTGRAKRPSAYWAAS